MSVFALLLLTGCNEYGFTDSRWTDVFQQDRANEVDLLVVIDNSCSMVEEQDNLARNFDAMLERFVEAEVDWRIGVTTTDVEEDRFRGRLQGGDDEIVLRGPLGEIDRVEYDREWGFNNGVSLFLRGQRTTSQDNDIRDNWCVAAGAYAPGQFGTPGQPNPQCNGGPANPIPVGPDTGPRPPQQGDLAISELMPQSAGDDRLCEWLEIASTTDDSLLLEGLEMFDRGRNHVVFPAYTLSPHDRLVVGRTPGEPCGTPVDIAFEEGFSLNNDVRWIDESMPDAGELFAEAVSQGTIGSGIELGMEASRLVFEEPFYTYANERWLRPEAKLAVLYVSDEDDLSPLPVDEYLDYFNGLKGLRGYRDPQMVTVSAIVGTDRPPSIGAPACISDDGLGFYGERYLAAANRTGGLSESICTEDFAPIVSRLGLTLAGLNLEFGLSRPPKIDTLTVEVYENEDNDSLIAELERDVDYSYDPERNAVLFTVEQAPPASTFIVVRYQILPNGATVIDPVDPSDPSDPGPLP